MYRFTAALLVIATAAFAATPDPCSTTSSISDVRLTISLKDQRSSFREGEIIPVVLSFTSSAEKRYWADVRNYDRSGRLTIETYCVEPTTRDPLEDYFRSGAFMGGGLGSTAQLSEKPFVAEAELNEWRQPKPGHYRLYVVSHRVWRPPDPNEPTPYGRIAESVRSNTIEFDVTEADPRWQAEQLQQALSEYEGAPADKAKESARKLRFLNTKESVDALARLYWGLNEQPGGWELMFGLFGSPYRAEAMAAMRREIAAPEHPVTQEFLHTLVEMTIDSDRAWNLPTFDPANRAAWDDYWVRRREHTRAAMRTEVSAVAAALPRKVGRARALTTEALSMSGDLLSANAARDVRKQLVASWADLPEQTKLQLIQYRWPLIAGPEMLPILVEFVSKPAPPARTMDAEARNEALQHIYELDAAQGRELILRDFHNSRAQPSIRLLKLLSAEDIVPVVQEAIARIEKSDARELDYQLLELYGDASPLASIKSVFQAHLGQWACDPQSALLQYFLRFDLDYGVQQVRASMAARKTTGCYRTLLQSLGKSLPKVQSIAIETLDDPDLEVAKDAALSLGRWGTAKAEKALWSRLERFHQEWKERAGELRPTPDYQGPVARATALESNLVGSIATGTNWICGPDKMDRLEELASPRQKIQIAQWRKQWEQDGAMIQPNWFPADRLSFGVLQYSNLDEEQFRAKLAQMPSGMKLYFQLWKPGQISPPLSMEKQQAVFESLRDHAARYGVTIEAKTSP